MKLISVRGEIRQPAAHFSDIIDHISHDFLEKGEYTYETTTDADQASVRQLQSELPLLLLLR